jgi:hypothetical protein
VELPVPVTDKTPCSINAGIWVWDLYGQDKAFLFFTPGLKSGIAFQIFLSGECKCVYIYEIKALMQIKEKEKKWEESQQKERTPDIWEKYKSCGRCSVLSVFLTSEKF